jgi:DNA-binding NtrC family response regulator
MRIGGEKAIGVDVRVIAATNRVPEQAVQEGRLREDLWYRLNVFPIGLPPLRERAGDIEVLAEHFLNELNTAGQTHKYWSSAARAALQRYSWPGNVRELKNLLHRAYIMAENEIGVQCLPPEILGGTGGGTVTEISRNGAKPEMGTTFPVQVGSSVADVEQRLIMATLEACNGNKQKAAEVLGVSLKTIYNRLNAYRENRAA